MNQCWQHNNTKDKCRQQGKCFGPCKRVKQFSFLCLHRKYRQEADYCSCNGGNNCCPDLRCGLIDNPHKFLAFYSPVFRHLEVPENILNINYSDVYHYTDGDGNT